MARVTVEDCEKIVPNRFDLVILAAQRARQIIAGDKITVDVDDEKKPVIALREIAAQTVSSEALKDAAIGSFRTFVPDDSEEEDIDDLEEDTYNPSADLEYLATEMSSDDNDVCCDDDELDIESPDIEIGDVEDTNDDVVEQAQNAESDEHTADE